MIRTSIVLVGLVAISACSPVAEIVQPPVKASLVGSASKAVPVNKTTTMAVRTFIPNAEKGKAAQEVTGARCTLTSDETRSTVVTPQQVILPKFKQAAELPNRGVPGSLVIRCKTASYAGEAVVTAAQKKAAAATGAGLAGFIITAAVTTAIAASTPWEYPAAVSVQLTKK